MGKHNSDQSFSKEDVELWRRVLAKRIRECAILPVATLTDITAGLSEKDSYGSPNAVTCNFLEQRLDEHFQLSIDSKQRPRERRTSLQFLTTVLGRIDDEYRKAVSNTQNFTVSSAPNTEIGNSTAPKATRMSMGSHPSNDESSSATWKKSGAAVSGGTSNHHGGGYDDDTQQRRTALDPKASLVTQKPAASTVENAPTPSLPRTADSTTGPANKPLAAALASVEVPASSLPDSPSLQTNSNMGIALSKSTKVANAPVVAKRPVATKPKTELAAVPKRPTGPSAIEPFPFENVYAIDKASVRQDVILFAKDEILGNCTWSSALEPRSAVRITYHPMPVSPNFMRHMVERLMLWDPYWKVDRTVAVAMMHRAVSVDQLSRGSDRPKRATACEVRLMPAEAKTIKGWGVVKPSGSSIPTTQGERRFMMRMLPLTPGKKKRADTHLWPKGTFIQIGGEPIQIVQRKQQAHDPSEWKYMSKPLDLTERIRSPSGQTKIEICTYDDDPYVVCLTVCSYQTPATLYQKVLDEWVEKLTEQEAMAQAVRTANQQTIVLEDADHRSNELNSFIFKLTCPLSMQIIETPVRGQHCTHWQCFDLMNFLKANQSVTGIRWHCPVCSKLVSCRDLQLCGLTAKLLCEFLGQTRPSRDRIQFFANATWQLLDEAKKRYNRKRPSEDGGADAPTKRVWQPAATVEHEVIELM